MKDLTAEKSGCNTVRSYTVRDHFEFAAYYKLLLCKEES